MSGHLLRQNLALYVIENALLTNVSAADCSVSDVEKVRTVGLSAKTKNCCCVGKVRLG